MYTHNITKALIILVGILYLNSSFGQIRNEKYFPGYPNSSFSYILDHNKVKDGIIISLEKSSGTKKEPILLKINKHGDIVWSATNPDKTDFTRISTFKFEVFSDGYIYGISTQYIAYDVSRTIWKVNPDNGEVLWVKDMPLNINQQLELVDYDSASFVTSFKNTNNITQLAFISKITGDTISTRSFGMYAEGINLAIDHNKNVFFSEDGSLYKFSLNNLDFPIWKREYAMPDGGYDPESKNMHIIHELYIDEYDNLYLFGRDGSTFKAGNGIIIKADNATGDEEWFSALSISSISSSEVRISDFKDYGGHIYVSFKQTVFANNRDYYKAAKANKTDGTVKWSANNEMTHLGKYTNLDTEQDVNAIDVDCKGNLYLTGNYYDSSLQRWGSMKIKETDGSKLYDITIKRDTAKNDERSEGIGTYVWGDTAIYLGHLITNPYSYRIPMIVISNANSGKVLERILFDEAYQAVSKTIEIVNKNDTLYILKQQEREIILEQYNNKSKLLRKYSFASKNMLLGGQIKLVDNYLYMSAFEVNTDMYLFNHINKTDKLILYKLDIKFGGVIQSDTLRFSPVNLLPFSLEADADTAFIFYSVNDTVYCRNWTATGFSNELMIEQAGKNMQYKGKLNIVTNYNRNELLYLGKNDIYKIDRNTLSKTKVYSFPTSRAYYDYHLITDTIYLAGNDLANTQLITAFNKKNLSYLWDKTYLGEGSIYKLVSDSANNLYACGISNNSITVQKLASSTGKVIWTNFEDTLKYPVTIPNDFEIHKTYNYLAIAGVNINKNGSSDAMIKLLDLQGNKLFSYIGKDELKGTSEANTLASTSDSILVGGALNRKNFGKQGFLFSLYNRRSANCITTQSNLTVKSCNSFISPSGKYIWTKSATYLDTATNSAGCDSIITVNLTINNSTSDTIKHTICDSFIFANDTIIYPGIYSITIQNSLGCDSTITLILISNTFDTSITQTTTTLKSNQLGVTYQWLDCDNGYAKIPGETNQYFTPKATGNYAVQLSDGVCIDTSSCRTVTNVSVPENNIINSLSVYPNPTSGKLYVEGYKGMFSYSITDILGKEYCNGITSKNIIDFSMLIDGVYLLKINSNIGERTLRIVKISY